MEIKLENIRKIFPPSNPSRIIFEIISNKFGILMAIIASIMFFASVFIWYKTVYHPDWSKEKKEEYIKNKEKGIVFNRDGLDEIYKEFELRKSEEEKPVEPVEDIFRVKK